jgi:hypothetical protein
MEMRKDFRLQASGFRLQASGFRLQASGTEEERSLRAWPMPFFLKPEA